MTLRRIVRLRWVLPIVLSMGGGFLFLFAFSVHVAIKSMDVSSSVQPLIRYVGVFSKSDPGALYEQSLLSDPDPLFLPTSYNYAIEPVVDEVSWGVSVVGESFLGAELLLGEVNFIAEYQSGGYYTPQFLDFVTLDFGQPFEVLGQGVGQVRADSFQRAGVYRLYAENRLLLEGVLPVSMDDILDATLWMPVRFHFQVSGKSLVGEAFMVNSSGSEQVDKVLRGFVGQLDLAVGLDDGYYGLEISP